MKYIIEKLIFEGFGFTRDNSNKPIFVYKSVPGDEVTLDIINHKKSYSIATINEVTNSGPNRITPECPFFNQCGGCEHQNISYLNQLKYKSEIFREVLERAKVNTEIKPIIAGSNEPFFYRNVIRFSIKAKDDQLHYYMNNVVFSQLPVEVNRCLLQSNTANKIMTLIKDTVSGRGQDLSSFWQLRIREGKNTNQFMVEIMTDTEKLPCKDELVSYLENIPNVKSIYHVVSSERDLKHLNRKLIYGSPIITEKIGPFVFQISPDSFFQTNSYGIKTLYNIIKSMTEPRMNETILDLYCGIGSIGIYLSKLAKKVVGIELSKSAVLDAKDNAKINKISNCEFICADAGKYLKNSRDKFDKIIVDPPRQGLDKLIITKLCNISPKRIVYVSCNPATFARDVKEFEKQGFFLKMVQPVDMFPQTHHIECVGLLEHK